MFNSRFLNPKKILIVAFVALVTASLFWLAPHALGGGTGKKSPGEYGTIKMNRNTDAAGMKAVLFPHWVHRAKFTCKVCHTDIGFPMKANALDIKMADIFAGKHCGNCHNGTTAFMPIQCDRCHSYGLEGTTQKEITRDLKDLERNEYGNKVNWVEAMRKGQIKPAANLDGTGELTGFDMDVIIPVTKFTPHPPDVKFPHKAHTEHLDCTSCHTKIFEMKKGGNPKMSMIKIISGQYCGVCHGRVAFPLADCFRCHSEPIIEDKMKKQSEMEKKDAEREKKIKEWKEKSEERKRKRIRKERRKKTLF